MVNRNVSPIFVVGFSRGGSNLLVNLIQSHPDVCVHGTEFQTLFRPKSKLPNLQEYPFNYVTKLTSYIYILLKYRKDPLKSNNYSERNDLNKFERYTVDKRLYLGKLKASKLNHNYHKYKDEIYKVKDIHSSRVLSKYLDGLVFITEPISKIFPDAIFIALVRNGLALSEGWMRRGLNPDQCIERYNTCCEKIIYYNNILNNFKIFKYEDLVSEPVSTINSIFEICSLDITKVKEYRLEHKKHYKNSGIYGTDNDVELKKMQWYGIKDIKDHIKSNLNQIQIQKLQKDKINYLKNGMSEKLSYFGYI